MNSLSTLPDEEARPEMDDLLHDYFQAEMPRPWPRFNAPKPTRSKHTMSFWSRYSGRVALAACIALFAAGYLTLGGFFSGSQTTSGLEHVAPDTAMKDRPVAPAPQTKPVEDPMPTPEGELTTHRKSK
jgi:hypothetical protein